MNPRPSLEKALGRNARKPWIWIWQRGFRYLTITGDNRYCTASVAKPPPFFPRPGIGRDEIVFSSIDDLGQRLEAVKCVIDPVMLRESSPLRA
jgi:hypothetical protein